ncbi:hypothetical protein, partial [Klebsiella michiganensis]|uniref:hypothetical protein n=1 Tax=Klebsiella michiganensis TaxID=1134687 RepID=UPI001BCA6F4D
GEGVLATLVVCFITGQKASQGDSTNLVRSQNSIYACLFSPAHYWGFLSALAGFFSPKEIGAG